MSRPRAICLWHVLTLDADSRIGLGRDTPQRKVINSVWRDFALGRRSEWRWVMKDKWA